MLKSDRTKEKNGKSKRVLCIHLILDNLGEHRNVHANKMAYVTAAAIVHR